MVLKRNFDSLLILKDPIMKNIEKCFRYHIIYKCIMILQFYPYLMQSLNIILGLLFAIYIYKGIIRKGLKKWKNLKSKTDGHKK